MIKGYYFITDAGLSKKGNISDTQSAIEAGASVVQYREKSRDVRGMLEEAKALKKICKGKALFIINDVVDISLSVDADGVHLGQGDVLYKTSRKILSKDKITGMTVHSLEEAMLAETKGVDYLSVGPIFFTTTKKDARSLCGTTLIKEIKSSCKVPIAAIGGINLDNVREVVDAGADAVCAISAVVTKDNVKEEIEKFQKFFD